VSEPAPRILLVDDDRSLAALLAEFLQLQGFEVTVEHLAEGGLRRIERDPPDLVVLDVMLPDASGFDALRRIRERHDVPVIMLTARGEESERILGLMGGADDYLPKPCSPLELAVRIRAVLRRAGAAGERVRSAASNELSVGALHLDPRRREIRAAGTVLTLTAGEQRLLELLMRRAGEVLTRAELTRFALDRPLEAYDRSIDTLISKLRRKLEDAGVSGDCLSGLRGHGYVLDPERAGTRPPT
jgi:two-component system, OmpR family, response regulator CpxR